MKRIIHIGLLLTSMFWAAALFGQITPAPSGHDLVFKKLAGRWDEAIPQGNGLLGTLIWQKGDNLRFSLDRADLWDLRPVEHFKTSDFRYKWVYDHWKNNDYKIVQDRLGKPYNNLPAPTKIPAAAIEFDVKSWGEAKSVRLYLEDALCEVTWPEGQRMLAFVDATASAGWFRFENVTDDIMPVLRPPAYNTAAEKEHVNAHSGQELSSLGYPEGKVTKSGNTITYEQEGWGGFKYMVTVSWKKSGNVMEGCWSISSEFPGWEKSPMAKEVVAAALPEGFEKSFKTHKKWWDDFWAKSSVHLPDKVLEKQWYLEQYKFGSAARPDSPPISLQAVWTADNGKIPPWKGDFHHDLNTQLSYWPAYSGNHLDLEEGFINWLWKNRQNFMDYTKTFFEADGLNVPGVSDLEGKPMGGWIQYSCGPTVGAWLGHHFYLHWRYTMDRDFLRERAYPWLRDVAVFFDEISIRRPDGKRKLPISSSPEINDNHRDAWFGETTNFDLALIRWTYEKAAELAKELGRDEEAVRWQKLLGEWPGLATGEDTGLLIAPGFPYSVSHRHFSHLMAIYPLTLIRWEQGENARNLMEQSVENLLHYGSDWWTGYSFSWLGNLQAQLKDGEGAAKTLHIFAGNFCLPNSFHVNGEQHNRGYSKFKYRPFTLEGNFAFASGIQEMLIQSHTPVVKIFPAIPHEWKDVSFGDLRTEGAFLVSAEKKKGAVIRVVIKAEKGGTVRISNPFDDHEFITKSPGVQGGDVIVVDMEEGAEVALEAK